MLKIDKETARLVAKVFWRNLGNFSLAVAALGLAGLGWLTIILVVKSFIPSYRPGWLAASVMLLAAVWTAIDIARAVRKRRKRHEG